MKEYIEREAVNCLMDKFIGYLDEDMIFRIKHKIKCIPTADVQEVRHGAWEIIDINEDENEITFMCSECGYTYILAESAGIQDVFKFCPECGVKMDRGEQE